MRVELPEKKWLKYWGYTQVGESMVSNQYLEDKLKWDWIVEVLELLAEKIDRIESHVTRM